MPTALMPITLSNELLGEEHFYVLHLKEHCFMVIIYEIGVLDTSMVQRNGQSLHYGLYRLHCGTR